jgi:ribosomal-protein-alanine N-acetyltransferase
MLKPPPPYELRPLRLSDLPALILIERASFSSPWKVTSYEYELIGNNLAHYQALLARRPGQEPKLLGYSGFWMLAGEAHISTIAVEPGHRGRGLGELLLLGLLWTAAGEAATMVTLEVRKSNVPAQALYSKYRFELVGERRRYYQDGEDALLMTAAPLDSGYRAFLAERQRGLFERLVQAEGAAVPDDPNP